MSTSAELPSEAPPAAKWALVLAGGDGKRLEALTRALTGTPIPKQYCRLTGDRSLLETTLARAGTFATPERTLVIVNRNHLALAHAQVRALPDENVLVQPENRDTGPGLLLSLLALEKRAPDAVVAVFPSDHYIGDEDTFLAHTVRAAHLVERMGDTIMLLGIRPDRPEPGYGYIEPVGGGTEHCPALAVAAFHEKPSQTDATRLWRRGALWNSFVMVFRVDRMLALIAAVRPADLAHMRALASDPDELGRRYHTLPRWNFSSDFLHHVAGHLMVLPVVGSSWSDWGTPQAIARTFAAERRLPPSSLLQLGLAAAT